GRLRSELQGFSALHSSSEWIRRAPAAGSKRPSSFDSRFCRDCPSNPSRTARSSPHRRHLRHPWIAPPDMLRTLDACRSRTACLAGSLTSSCRQLRQRSADLIRPLRSCPVTSVHRYYGSVRPSAPLRYSRLAVFSACASPLASEQLVPAVPRQRLHPLHAPSTPVVARPVIRHPAS